MNKSIPILRLVSALLIASLLGGCSKKSSSLEGNWILTQNGSERVAEKDSYFLKATANTLELICLRTGESLFGGKREYQIEGEKLYLQEQGETPDEESTILSLSKNRVDLAEFNGWSRASFKKAADETVEQLEGVINPAAPEEPVVSPIEEPQVSVSIAGIWEKPEAAMPFPGNGLIVEINEKQIRAQVFSQALKTQFDLVGAQQPCTYSLEFDKKARVGKGMIFCKHNNKTYSMKVCVPDGEKDSMNIEFGNWKFSLKTADEERLSEISQVLGNSLKRLTSD